MKSVRGWRYFQRKALPLMTDISMQQYPVQQRDTLFAISHRNDPGRVWIAEQCWQQRWCELVTR